MQQQISKVTQSSVAPTATPPLRSTITTLTGGPRPPGSSMINGVTGARIPHHILANKNLTPQEQQALQKQLAQHGRIVVASSGGVTMPGGIRPAFQGSITGGVNNQAGSAGGKGPMGKGNMGAAAPGMLMNAANAKDKPRNTYYSSAVG